MLFLLVFVGAVGILGSSLVDGSVAVTVATIIAQDTKLLPYM
jgi:hypothetical protein